ncbi:MAG: ABC transporter ATP-binding protein [Leptospirillia bacterium]
MTHSDGPGIAVQLEAVTKIYSVSGEELPALRGISLAISGGESVAIVGSSGSGKSTLLHLMGLLDRPTSGEIYLEGRRVDTLTPTERAVLRNRSIGFIFQNFQLIPRTSALENVEMPLLYRGLSARERRDRARELLASVGMGDRERHTSSQLSGGQQQRVAIARAMAGSPGLMLADEPTGNLDSRSSATILDLLLSLRDRFRTTLVLVTHDMEIAQHLSRTVRVRDGRLEASP